MALRSFDFRAKLPILNVQVTTLTMSCLKDASPLLARDSFDEPVLSEAKGLRTSVRSWPNAANRHSKRGSGDPL